MESAGPVSSVWRAWSSAAGYAGLRMPELRLLCKQRGIQNNGARKELVEQLEAQDANGGPTLKVKSEPPSAKPKWAESEETWLQGATAQAGGVVRASAGPGAAIDQPRVATRQKILQQKVEQVEQNSASGSQGAAPTHLAHEITQERPPHKAKAGQTADATADAVLNEGAPPPPRIGNAGSVSAPAQPKQADGLSPSRARKPTAKPAGPGKARPQPKGTAGYSGKAPSKSVGKAPPPGIEPPPAKAPKAAQGCAFPAQAGSVPAHTAVPTTVPENKRQKVANGEPVGFDFGLSDSAASTQVDGSGGFDFGARAPATDAFTGTVAQSSAAAAPSSTAATPSRPAATPSRPAAASSSSASAASSSASAPPSSAAVPSSSHVPVWQGHAPQAWPSPFMPAPMYAPPPPRVFYYPDHAGVAAAGPPPHAWWPGVAWPPHMPPGTTAPPGMWHPHLDSHTGFPAEGLSFKAAGTAAEPRTAAAEPQEPSQPSAVEQAAADKKRVCAAIWEKKKAKELGGWEKDALALLEPLKDKVVDAKLRFLEMSSRRQALHEQVHVVKQALQKKAMQLRKEKEKLKTLLVEEAKQIDTLRNQATSQLKSAMVL